MMKNTTNKNRIKTAFAIATLCFGVVAADEWGFDEQQPAPAQPVPVAQPTPVPTAPAPVEQPAPDVQAAPDPVDAVVETAPSGPEIIDVESTLRSGTELSARAMATAPFVMRRSERPGVGRVLKSKDRIIFHAYDKVTVKPFRGAVTSFSVGDTVDVLNSEMRSAYKGGTVQVVSRTGRGVVVGFSGKRAVVQIIDVWGTIRGGESIAKTTPFRPIYSNNLTASDIKLQATVVMRLGSSDIPQMHELIVIDKGSSDGVKVGDFFRVMEREKPNRMSENVLKAQVVNVTANHATLMALKVRKEAINLGDEAVLSFRSRD